VLPSRSMARASRPASGPVGMVGVGGGSGVAGTVGFDGIVVDLSMFMGTKVEELRFL